MNPDKLRATLAELHAELIRAPRLSEESRRLLRAAMHDIERLIDRPAASAAPTPSSLDEARPHNEHRLEALAVEFEAEHPTLAALVRQVIDVLGAAGL